MNMTKEREDFIIDSSAEDEALETPDYSDRAPFGANDHQLELTDDEKKLINNDDFFGIKMLDARKLLPNQVSRVHGCLGCEWKGKKDRKKLPLCPYDYKLKQETNKHGICPRRAVYLLMFVKDPDNIKSYTEWQRSYNAAIAQRENMIDYIDVETLRNDIEDLKEVLDSMTDQNDDLAKQYKRNIKDKQMELSYARQRWESLLDKGMKFSDKKLDRETAKKIDITTTKIKPSDITAAIRGAEQIIDAEYKDIIDEDE